MNENIIPHTFQVTRDDRSKKLNQNPCLIWYTGLSGSGKSTLANAVEKSLFDKGFLTYSLDGDNVRHGISNNLGFSAKAIFLTLSISNNPVSWSTPYGIKL